MVNGPGPGPVGRWRIDRARHTTGEIGLGDIGFAPLVERRAEHIKIQATSGPS